MPCHCSCSQSPVCHRGGLCSIAVQSTYFLWWAICSWGIGTFFVPALLFTLSVSFHQCSTLIFFYMLLLPEGQPGEVWEPANNNGFRKLVCIVQKITFTQSLKPPLSRQTTLLVPSVLWRQLGLLVSAEAQIPVLSRYFSRYEIQFVHSIYHHGHNSSTSTAIV
jgi:hypothetical protein